MATRKEHSEFAAALDALTTDRPDLAATLGDDPSRADLLEALKALDPDLASSAKAMPKIGLVRFIAALMPAPDPDPLVSFTTRIPEPLAQEVKAEAVARGISIQELVAGILRAGLEQDS